MVAELSYPAQLVKQHDRDRFMAALFVPPPQRESLLALLSLDAELAQIHAKVREEMIGHIRYAWWQEALEALYAGHPPREQPVLLALAGAISQGHLPEEVVMPLLASYREHYPEPPPGHGELLDALSARLVEALAPGAVKSWRGAQEKIARHRARHGQKCSGWLAFRLLSGI